MINNYKCIYLSFGIAAAALLLQVIAQRPLELAAMAAIVCAAWTALLLWSSSFSRWNSLLLAWLVVPYVIFMLSWLNIWFSLIGLFVLTILVLKLRPVSGNTLVSCTREDGLALLLGFVWLNLWGIGDVGHQSPDWIMHTGRLFDLWSNPWPVIYTQGAILGSADWPQSSGAISGYFAFQLPAALVGKLFQSFDVAKASLYVWAWMGFSLLIVHGKILALKVRPVVLVGLLILFGGPDIVWFSSDHLISFLIDFFTVEDVSEAIPEESPVEADLTAVLQFWPGIYFGYFFGSFLSLAAQFYYSPNQMIATCAVATMLLSCYEKKQFNHGVAWLALLLFWSPFACVALTMLWGGLMLHNFRQVIRSLDWLMIFAVLVLLGLFMSFYGSSTGRNLQWAWELSSANSFVIEWLRFHAYSWGGYALVVLLAWRYIAPQTKPLLICLLFCLIVISLLELGACSDLKVRGSGALYFILGLLLFDLLCKGVARKNIINTVALLFILMLGAVTGLSYIAKSAENFNNGKYFQRVADYEWGYEFMQPVDSFFMCYLSSNNDFCQK